ncbi:MFS general substrate transporter [Dothidotthia symphoricarpi CBS 119687]|uniref:MFS general substrate transporter n=1 Tax=Dothidotthia symphoricarpi CBS 119687 TaxID=1392245 RepID=A0A6A6ADQ7_9PLEO|nr:MFS general substrate transporter [Dothidotthia symphoricarpi CBS 119687]KAF2129225.1 MFS general substrate transporter [Dothidotthia symphoricarpi CBS 119687]
MSTPMRTQDDLGEKGDGLHLERTETRTPPGEVAEKQRLNLGPTRSAGPPMNSKLFMTLLCMSFLWVGSQIPLYLFGGCLPLIYQDIGGVDRYVWFIIGYLIPNAALCPFVGALSDIFGRRTVAMVGQVMLIIGPIITSTAHTMNIAIAGNVFSGVGAGLNELIALAGTGEVVAVKDRGRYVGLVVITILPFCPSVLYSQLIAVHSWRWNGLFVSLWNLIGLVLVVFCYHDPSRLNDEYTARYVLSQLDYIGGFLSIGGVTCFMMGLQWGATQYPWGSAHNLAPLIIGLVMLIAFFIWEFFAPHPMVPRAIFHKAKKTMIVILLITFLSGGNFFVVLLLWPTQVYNVYGDDPVGVGVRGLPVGFGIILGAVICLVLIPATKGRIRLLMIFFTGMMTAFTGAMAIGTPHNLGTMYAIVTFASLGVGGVIIPCSIIAQIACPDELIATVTAITLSLRYLGGAIGFAVYLNLFEHKVVVSLTDIVATKTLALGLVVNPFRPEGLALIQELTELVGNARFSEVKEILANNPLVLKRDSYGTIIAAAQEAFALAYRWPYYCSIAFGGSCFILSLFVGDIGSLLDAHIAHPPV